jgi:hypothetical protein
MVVGLLCLFLTPLPLPFSLPFLQRKKGIKKKGVKHHSDLFGV